MHSEPTDSARMRRVSAVLPVLLVTVVAVGTLAGPAAGSGAASNSGASSAVRPAAPAVSRPESSAVSPSTTGSVPVITETWSTGPLADAGAPIAQSSPVPVTLGGTPSVVVGDRGGNLYAFGLADPTPASPPGLATPVVPTGWTGVRAGAPVDATPSVATAPGGQPEVLVGSGSDAAPVDGGYQAYAADGRLRWVTHVVNPPSDGSPAGGVFAGLSVGALQGTAAAGPSAVAGSLGQVAYALDPVDGAPRPGWPYLNTDSTHATTALADLFGTGRAEAVEASDQTAGFGNGQRYQDGGQLRVLSGTGNLVCRAVTDQVLDSSPAVGGILAGGATGIVDGTGAYFAGASDTDSVLAFGSRCTRAWSHRLDGSTFSSPALADVLGNGRLQVVEGTDGGPSRGGSVWALDGATGSTLWTTPLPGHEVIGSVTAADLFGQGYADVLVPTTNGLVILDGRTGAVVTWLDGPGQGDLGLQNSPLVTVDPDGSVGITLAGYIGSNLSGRVDHFEVAGPAARGAVGPGTWPMFHHDAQLTGDAGGTPAPGSVPACSVPSAVMSGYDLVSADGGVSTYPSPGRPFCGSLGGHRLNAPVVAMAMAPATGGYWLVGSDGGIFAFGDAGFHGSTGGLHLNEPIVGMAATADGGGYWLVASDGGIFAFGDAPYDGSLGGEHLRRPVVGMARDPASGGYWLVASDGGVFTYGGARFEGSAAGAPTAGPVIGLTGAANGSGYLLAGADGGVFSYGVPFAGSANGRPLDAPVTGIAGW